LLQQCVIGCVLEKDVGREILSKTQCQQKRHVEQLKSRTVADVRPPKDNVCQVCVCWFVSHLQTSVSSHCQS